MARLSAEEQIKPDLALRRTCDLRSRLWHVSCETHAWNDHVWQSKECFGELSGAAE
jgi:hypothetical protein